MKKIMMILTAMVLFTSISMGEFSFYDAKRLVHEVTKNSKMLQQAKKYMSEYSSSNEPETETTTSLPVNNERRTVKGRRIKFPVNLRAIINNQNCSQIIHKSLYDTCYDYRLKSPLIVAYRINGDDLRGGNIKKRPSFYEERSIPRQYRASPYDFSHTGYDRGHCRSHASSSWSRESIYETYSMANIVPQAATVNRKTWIKAEKYSRLVARKIGYVNVIEIMDFGGFPKRIGRNHIAVADGFYKILYNQDDDFKKCFYYKNNLRAKAKGDKLKHHVIDCGKIYY